MEHKVPFILCVIAGIIMIQVAWIGSIGFFSYLGLITTIPALAEYAWLVEILLYVLTTIAGLGGFAVIVGGVLLTRSKETTGKLVIGIAVGMSLIGVIIKTITTLWLFGGTSFLDAFLLEATITEWIAVFMTIFARRMV